MLTIAVCTYKDHPHLLQTLDSIFANTRLNFLKKVIIVVTADSISQDIIKYCKKFRHKIQIIHNTINSLAHARSLA